VQKQRTAVHSRPLTSLQMACTDVALAQAAAGWSSAPPPLSFPSSPSLPLSSFSPRSVQSPIDRPMSAQHELGEEVALSPSHVARSLWGWGVQPQPVAGAMAGSGGAHSRAHGGNADGNNITRYVSPFISPHAAPVMDGQATSVEDGLDESQATPRSARSPIGTKPILVGHHSRGHSVRGSAEYASGSRGSGGGEFIQSSFHTARTPTPTTSSQPHSQSSLASGQLSPHSPEYSSMSQGALSSARPSQTSRVQSPGVLEEQSLAGVFQSSQHSSMQAHHRSAPSSQYQSAHPSPQGTYTLLPTLQEQPVRRSPSQSQLPPLPVVEGSAPGASTSDVAYVVLPNGEVQAIPLAALQSHLGTSTTPTGTGTQPSPQSNQQPPPSQHTSPPAQFREPAPVHQQSQQQQTYNPGLQYDAPPSDGDAFSLATLSTQTLPLFTPQPAAPPTHDTSHMMAQHSHSHFQQQQQQQPQQGQHAQPVAASRRHTPSSLPPINLRREQFDGSQIHQSLQPQHAPHSHGSSHSHTAPAPSSHSQTTQPGPGSLTLEGARELVRQLSLHGAPSQINASHQAQALLTPHAQSPSHSSGSFSTLQSHAHSSGGTGESTVQMAKSQAGSRLIQTKLAQNDSHYYASIFEDVYESLPELMVDLFGNYLVQKLITYANDSQRLQMLLKVLPELLEISCDRQGTRAIQKLIDSLKLPSERHLVLEWLTMPMQGQAPGGGSHEHEQSALDGHLSPQLHALSPALSATSPVHSPSHADSSPAHAHSAPSSPRPLSALYVGGVLQPDMPRLIHLIRDSNGSHVVHSILDSFPQNMLQPIHCNAVHHCRSLAVDQHG
jgi:hypothetical protein